MFKCSLKNINCNPVYTEKKKKDLGQLQTRNFKIINQRNKDKNKNENKGKGYGIVRRNTINNIK